MTQARQSIKQPATVKKDAQAEKFTTASTEMSAPARVLVSRGVITIAPRVEAVVMRTDNATSPCAMYVATLEDCRRHLEHQTWVGRCMTTETKSTGEQR